MIVIVVLHWQLDIGYWRAESFMIFRRVSGDMNLDVGLWSLSIKCDHFFSRGATVDPSPAFQSRAFGRILVLVAAATVDNERQNQPSLPRLQMHTLSVPALKSRAKLTWSLRDREDGCCIYFSKTINAGLNSPRRYAAGADQAIFVKRGA